MDYFPDAARRFRPFAPIGIKIFYFCIKQLNYSLYYYSFRYINYIKKMHNNQISINTFIQILSQQKPESGKGCIGTARHNI